MFTLFILLIFSIALLYFGAEFALSASEKVGHKLGLSPLFVGMVLVGFGTSLPEFFVSHMAALENNPAIAYGGLIGSNIANLLFIVGVVALFCKLDLSQNNLRSHVWLHSILAASLFYVISRENLDFLTVLPLIIIMAVYLFILFKEMKSESTHTNEVITDSNWKLSSFLVIGFAFLFIGGKFLIDSVVGICDYFQIDQYIVSAIVIALGTSFPELVTSLVAVKKKKDTDLIVGNIIGSNLFNCAFILATLVFYNFKMSSGLIREIVIYNIGSSLVLVLMLMRSKIGFKSALCLLGLYSYMVYLWMGNV